MMKICINLLECDVPRGSFDCGNKAINELIENSYIDVLTQMAYAFSVRCEGVVVAYYKIRLGRVLPEKCPDGVREYLDEGSGNEVPCVYLEYIAVDKKYQRKGIGRAVMLCILKEVKTATERFPFRLMTLDAVCEKVEWYEKQGFLKMPQALAGQKGYNEYMYMDLLMKEKKLTEYCESFV